ALRSPPPSHVGRRLPASPAPANALRSPPPSHVGRRLPARTLSAPRRRPTWADAARPPRRRRTISARRRPTWADAARRGPSPRPAAVPRGPPPPGADALRSPPPSHVGRRRPVAAPRVHHDAEARRENATAARARRNHPRGGAVAQRPRPSTYGLGLRPARRTRSRQREHMSEHAPGVGAPSAAVSAFSPSPAGPRSPPRQQVRVLP